MIREYEAIQEALDEELQRIIFQGRLDDELETFDLIASEMGIPRAVFRLKQVVILRNDYC